MRKADTTIHVADVDPSNHKQIANEINEHLASFPNTQQPLDLADLPAYLPSPVPPPQVQQWDIYEDLKIVLRLKLEVQMESLLDCWKNLHMNSVSQ